ncbi:flagellar filament capping protein FliD [Pseudomonas sp. CFBP 13719]|uniref:flagellar filament capping protein FliD n=1 Tax=Pseudomonas sp. CFBP 13719 TaxID=2775303 RepID=UPI001781F34C|nr:flagellar filament capping protein FliD [Pseudomonas sp. CFBP 13719]MBD8683768.1 flagellar filament capping protein FliD [Pseudomonas sp. CFBP 13719]
MATVSSTTGTTAATTTASTSSTTTSSTSGAIKSSGVGTGIDTDAIVKALVNAEKAPKQKQIDTQTLTTTTTLTAVGTVKSSLETYRAAVAAMNKASAFSGLTGASSNDKAASVTVTDSASDGTYSLEVTTLATASKISSGVYADKSEAVVNATSSAQTLTITQSFKDSKISIPAGATLAQTRDLINTQLVGRGISANILTDASGSRLVLSSSTTGKGTEISMTADAGSGLDKLTASTTVNEPTNATYKIDGIEMESSTNTVAAAISGVSIKLLEAGAAKTTISVSTNTDTLKKATTGFVDAYNALMTQLNTLTKVSTGADGTTSGGGLTGDSTVRHLIQSMRNELVSSSGSSKLTLSHFGINTDQKTGLLAMDDAKWNTAMADPANVAAIQDMFTGKDGLLSRMTTATDSYAVKGGILASRSDSLSGTLTKLTEQQQALDRRIKNLTDTLNAKYTAMDTLVAQLNATSKSIMTTLNALNKADSD